MRYKNLNVRLSPSERMMLEALSLAVGRSWSDVVRLAIKAYAAQVLELEQEQEKPEAVNDAQ